MRTRKSKIAKVAFNGAVNQEKEKKRYLKAIQFKFSHTLAQFHGEVCKQREREREGASFKFVSRIRRIFSLFLSSPSLTPAFTRNFGKRDAVERRKRNMAEKRLHSSDKNEKDVACRTQDNRRRGKTGLRNKSQGHVCSKFALQLRLSLLFSFSYLIRILVVSKVMRI